MATIANGKNRPINAIAGTVPDVSGALTDRYQPLVFEKITKTMVAGDVVETGTPINFRGNVTPLDPRRLMLKPEGQRAWTWFQVFADPVLELEVDDEGAFQGVKTRVMVRDDFSLYGYVRYEWAQDWTTGGGS